MRNRIKSTIVIILFFVMTVGLNTAFSQEWSKSQKEVWKNVESYWNLFAQGNMDEMMTYYHENYSGWANSSPLPGSKARATEGLKHFLEGNKIIMHNMDPVAIEIHDNVAVVHYYYSFIFKNSDGKEQNNSGRWTDILSKQGNKWILIGDHGGSTSGN